MGGWARGEDLHYPLEMGVEMEVRQQQVVFYGAEDENWGRKSSASLPACLVSVACGFPRRACWIWGLI